MAKEKFRRISLAFAALACLITPAVAQVSNGKVTTVDPAYTNNTVAPLSLSTIGRLRVDAVISGTISSIATQCNYPGNSISAASVGLNTCVMDGRGSIRVGIAQPSISTVDNVANLTAQSYSQTSNVSFAANLGANEFVYDPVSTTWFAARGNAQGAWAQGNVASGVADAGNPVKIGCVFNTAGPTLTNGQRGDVQCNNRGGLGIVPYIGGVEGSSVNGSVTDGRSNILAAFASLNYPLIFNGATWDRHFACTQSAVVNVTAGATTQIVALAASQQIRVCSFAISMSAAGTAKFVNGTGANCGTGTADLTGAMPLATGTPMEMSAGNGSLFRTPASNALCVAAVTGNAVGFVSYAQF